MGFRVRVRVSRVHSLWPVAAGPTWGCMWVRVRV